MSYEIVAYLRCDKCESIIKKSSVKKDIWLDALYGIYNPKKTFSNKDMSGMHLCEDCKGEKNGKENE